jgi:hypothetical protein
LFVMGLTWALGFGVAVWGIWRLRSWGRTWTLIAIVAYWLQYWVMRLTLTRAPEEATRRPADFLLSLLGVALVVSFLFLPKIRRLYRNE